MDTAQLKILAISIVPLAAVLFFIRFGFLRRSLSATPGAGQGGPGVNDVERSTNAIGLWVIIFALLGMTAITAWSYGTNKATFDPQFWELLGTDAMIAAAAAAVGGLLGFVFGIPRTLDPASRAAVAAAASQGPAATSQAALAANTNLERVSDWLTTLIIGATLVQSQKVVGWIGGLGSSFTQGTVTNESLIPVVVVYFFALAFLGIYLITRLYLTFALQQTLAFLTGSTVIQAPQIATLSLPAGRVGVAYGPVPLQCSGGSLPLDWTATNLPNGLALDPASGQISGTPSAATAPGAICTIAVKDSSASRISTSRDFTLRIVP